MIEIKGTFKDFPLPIQSYLRASRIYDSSSHSQAKVWYLDSDYYLKMDNVGKLEEEARLTQYFFEKGLAVEVVEYVSSEDTDYLLTRAADGETALAYLDKPQKLCQIMAETLKYLHSLDQKEFFLPNRLDYYIASFYDNYKAGTFYEKALLPRFGIANREEAFEIVQANQENLKADTLIHGDFCLPNIVLKDNQFSCFLDLGLAGISDKHVDLFWAIWSLHYNLGRDDYADYFLDCYGRENVDEEMIRVVAACEALR
ncbi:aminoglycoside 3'-phosphotransferase [Streptococcus oricebi]|uniref:Aminoglycoside phosphotransferase APH(3') n=1 Tax=Streptococcus oricebi TaxID=1547447 RepID=A0ABS5B0M6_9STRE|nr:aminoglycoside 3'-phosphotransferase [Streptococcus oricebi]MBP2622381.1 aminoglycoside phosphotransferase APH(3') [Streptococcus oricebi]